MNNEEIAQRLTVMLGVLWDLKFEVRRLLQQSPELMGAQSMLPNSEDEEYECDLFEEIDRLYTLMRLLDMEFEYIVEGRMEL